jgi:RNA polymerase sigma-70 factor, ECF subfamily
VGAKQRIESAGTADAALIARLSRGDERAFVELTDGLGGSLRRIARVYTSDDAAIDDALQDTWLAVLRGLDRYQARSSLRTWVTAILLNRLRSRLRADERLIPFSQSADLAQAEPALPPDRFNDEAHARWPHHWRVPPRPWPETPEEQLLAAEARSVLDGAIAALPAAQREVITLRDVEGWSADEVCSLLQLSAANQRVLLHRARSRVRGALEVYYAEDRT